jgi:hypothetical protein
MRTLALVAAVLERESRNNRSSTLPPEIALQVFNARPREGREFLDDSLRERYAHFVAMQHGTSTQTVKNIWDLRSYCM